MIPRAIVPLAAVFALVSLIGDTSSVPAAPGAPAGNDDIAVQARGPVHEGYAQPFNGTPQPGPVVPKAPPDPVPELPPDQKPEGDNVQWVPGYWSWDGDKNDYVWVSGFWRVPPPDRKWVAGYWQKADDGWRWVPGYWAAQGQERPPLLDAPPEPPDAGPSIPAPDDRSLYVPGVWVWRHQRYAWRPGFWSPAQLGWVWVPAHYVWTPGGCVFVNGYWDFPLETRGVLFAPVVFCRPLWRTPGWCYRPSYVVAVDTPWFSALFVRSSDCHYYFGDYYDPDYGRAGYQPWCHYGRRHHDPLYGYYRWSHHDDPGWLRGMSTVYADRRDGLVARPPRTLAEQTAVVRRAGPAAASSLTVVQPLGDFQGGLRLAAIDRAQVVRHQAAAQRIQEAARQRVQVERPRDRGLPVVIPSPARSPSPGPARAQAPEPPVIGRQPADRPAPQSHEIRPSAPVIVNRPTAPAIANPGPRPAPAPERHVSPPPSYHPAPAPAYVSPPAPPPERHVGPPPPRQPAPAHVSPPPAPPPERHASPPPSYHPAPAPARVSPPAPPPERHASPPPPRQPAPAPPHVSPPPRAPHPPPPPPRGGGNHDNGHKKK